MAKSEPDWWEKLTWPLRIIVVILCSPVILIIAVWGVFLSMITNETLTPNKQKTKVGQASDRHEHDHH